MIEETIASPAAIARRLRDGFRGSVIGPNDARYGEVRRVWNGTIDRYPLTIVRPVDEPDVAAALRLAIDLALPVAVRGGGHSVAGFGTCDSGLVIDLSAMRSVRVDPAARHADVGGGARWADVDAATGSFGLATTGGLISSTGVGGFTLGGGIGWLVRRFGLACDNLVGATLVTPLGEVLDVDGSSDPELLWALRGGGGNFGIATRLRFALHPVDAVVAGMILHPLDGAASLIAEWRRLTDDAPDELTTMAVLLTAPPAPFIPDGLRGRTALAFVVCWSGDPGAIPGELDALRRLGPPAADLVGPMAYPDLQRMLDDTAPAGLRHHWKSGQVRSLDEGTIARLVEAAGRLPSHHSQIHVHQVGGAANRLAADATAYSHRESSHVVNILATWDRPAADEGAISWARGTHRSIEAALSGAYVNFLGLEAGAPPPTPYAGSTAERLAAVKARTDPENLLRLNHNVAPLPGR